MPCQDVGKEIIYRFVLLLTNIMVWKEIQKFIDLIWDRAEKVALKKMHLDFLSIF